MKVVLYFSKAGYWVAAIRAPDFSLGPYFGDTQEEALNKLTARFAEIKTVLFGELPVTDSL